MTLAAGARIGPYEIVAPLGAGGMGEVYRALDPRLRREVAIKVLPASFAASAEALRRFEQEARVIGALNHPNLLSVHDVGQQDGAPYLVTELLEGATLRQRLAEALPPLRTAIDWVLADRERSRRGPRQGRRPPRPEAGEPVRHPGRKGQDPGFRPGQAVGFQ